MIEQDKNTLEIREVQYDGIRLRFRELVCLKPFRSSENRRYLRIEKPALGLDVFARTPATLLDEVAEALVLGWKQYALAPDNDLSPKALELKQRLLAAASEMTVTSDTPAI
jgi:hypothetical protein